MPNILKLDSSYLNYCENDKETVILKAYLENGTFIKTAEALGIDRKTVAKVIKKIVNRYNTDPNRKVTEPKLVETENRTLPEYYIKGTSTLLDGKGNVKLQWVKTSSTAIQVFNAYKEAIREIIEDIKNNNHTYQPTDIGHSNTNADILTVYPIGDLHLGMFSWSKETGEDYDINIAKNLILDAFNKMVKSAPDSEKCLLINLGDFFHIDDTSNETFKSKNRLDVDSRYPKILKTGLMIMTNIIEMLLKKHKYVIVRNAPGNHDPHTSLFLNEYIAAWFNNEDRLIIESNYNTFWFYKFYNNLIGVTHGDTVKISELPEIMAHDAKEYWSDTEFRYWYIGHFHHEQKKEFRTCVVESFGVLAAKDKWHYDSGYRSKREIKYKVLHKDYGEIQEGTINIKMLNVGGGS